jgi:hypothetical protein
VAEPGDGSAQAPETDQQAPVGEDGAPAPEVTTQVTTDVTTEVTTQRSNTSGGDSGQ